MSKPDSSWRTSSVAGGFGGLWQQGKEAYQHSIVPYVSAGNVNSGDVLTSSGSNSCYLYPAVFSLPPYRDKDDQLRNTGFYRHCR